MSEQPPSIKIPDLSNLPRGAISIKGLPVGRNTRLPSIRTPRDLTLGAQPKRVFAPKIPVRREKKTLDPEPDKSQASNNNKLIPQNHPVTSPKWKPKQRVLIQTEGALYGDGLAPSSSKKDPNKEPVQRFASKKSHIKKELDMSEMENDLNEILRDDFIDDDDDDEQEDLRPVIYPYSDDAEKIKKELVTKKEFGNENFAKDLGFDVNKIASFIKKEKDADVTSDISSNINPKLYNILTSDDPTLLLMQFPVIPSVQKLDDQPRGASNASTDQTKDKGKNETNLSSLPDGMIGKLQILKSGRTRLLIGGQHYYMDFYDSLKSKYEAVSVKTNTQDMIVLGNIKHKMVAVPDVNKLLNDFK